jgi:hypothetical protein
MSETKILRRGSPKKPKQVPLYVMLEPDQKDRYERAAKSAGLSLREYVVQALESFGAQQVLSVVGTEDTSEEGRMNTLAWAMRRLNEHSLRINTLEKTVEAIQSRVDAAGRWGATVEDALAEHAIAISTVARTPPGTHYNPNIKPRPRLP